MARILGLLPAALIAARGNTGAGGFYRMLRELGTAARQSEVYALYREAKAITSTPNSDVFEPLNEVPDTTGVPPWPTVRATGIRQNVSLVYRDRTTGQISKTFYSNVSENGVTREEAISNAIQAYASNAEAYNQDLIGAVHTSARELVPLGF